MDSSGNSKTKRKSCKYRKFMFSTFYTFIEAYPFFISYVNFGKFKKAYPFFNVWHETLMLLFCYCFLLISSLLKMPKTDLSKAFLQIITSCAKSKKGVALTNDYICLQKKKNGTLFYQVTLVATRLLGYPHSKRLARVLNFNN